MLSSSRAGRGKKSETATPTLRTEGMEQSITEVRELKNRDGQVGIAGEKRSRRGGERATRKEGDGRRGPLPPRSKRELLKKSAPPAPAAAPLPIQTHYSEKAHSLMASVVGSPRRGPVTASPDAHGNTAESFPRSRSLVGLRSGWGGCRRTRTPFRQFIPSDCFKSEEEQVHSARMSRWVRTGGNTG